MLMATLVSAVLAVSSPGGASSSEQVRPTVLDLVDEVKLTLGDLSLESDWVPSSSPVLKLFDPLRFAAQQIPPPLDFGGGVSQDTRAILGLLLGFFVGFGIGHLVVKDRAGFILFLIVDIVIIAVTSPFGYFTRGLFWYVGGLALFVSHVIQGLDAYSHASGESLVRAARERSIQLANIGRDSAAPTSRAYAFSF